MNPQDGVDELAPAILEHLADALVYADVQGVIRRWNDAASRLFGFSRDEALGTSLDLVIPESLREAHWRGYRRAMSEGRTRMAGRPTITRGVHKDGRRLYVEMSFAVVLDHEGHAIGSVAVARDATARREAERASAQKPVAQHGSG